MKPYLLLLSGMLIALAWLLPHHYRPWVTYSGEALAFVSLFALSLIFIKDKLHIPTITLPILGLSLVPLLQYVFGLGFFFSKAFLSMVYIFAFWLSIVLVYNLSLNQQRAELFKHFCILILGVAVTSSVIAICQWMAVEQYFKGFMANLSTGRPYANFAQPNNMATFLILGLLSALYLFESKKLSLKILIPSASLLIFAVALSQSRTSWVALICIMVYMLYQQYRGYLNIKWYAITAWGLAFIGCLFIIPHLAALFADALDAPIKSVDLARRATGDMSRIAIWHQMVQAILQQPWWGYGWHQTSVAYTTISDTVQGPVWVKSAHNVVLDFILWNGIIIALPFMAYFSYWLIRLNLKIQSLESVIAMLMLGAILVHSMLEFPLFYAYFLLPFGFILGVLQAQQKDTSIWSWSPHFMQITIGLSAALLMLIHRDYLVAGPKLSESSRFEKQPEKWTKNEPIYLLSELDARIEWIRLNPYTQLNPEQIKNIDEMVLNYPVAYDLIKYARVLAFNGYESEAKHQLWRLKTLKKIDLDYQALIGEQPK